MLPFVRFPKTRARAPRRALLLLAMLGGFAALPASAGASSVSANWAGYVALPKSSTSHFKSISGTWTVPAVTCTAGSETYSAVWVGLGGYHRGSDALEQIGTEADCLRDGDAIYTTWFELIPAGPVKLKLKESPGDQMIASVTVAGHDVTLRLNDLTRSTHASITRHAAALDTSSAEWILEAPSSCLTVSACQTLPLSDFETASFSAATATIAGRTVPIGSSDFSRVKLELRQSAGAPGSGHGHRHARAEAGASVIAATPTALSGESFSVRREEEPLQQEEVEGPPLPGFGGAGT